MWSFNAVYYVVLFYHRPFSAAEWNLPAGYLSVSISSSWHLLKLWSIKTTWLCLINIAWTNVLPRIAHTHTHTHPHMAHTYTHTHTHSDTHTHAHTYKHTRSDTHTRTCINWTLIMISHAFLQSCVFIMYISQKNACHDFAAQGISWFVWFQVKPFCFLSANSLVQ